MRFYKRDGSYKINQEDSEFGWWFHDILFEGNANDTDRGKESLIFEQNEVEDSVDLTCFLECSKKLIVEKHEPTVEIHVPVGVVSSQMSPEGYVRKDDLNPFNMSDAICYAGVKVQQDKKLLRYVNFNSVRTKMCNIITLDTLEGNLLISLIDCSRFSKFNPNSSPLKIQEHIPELQGRSIFFDRQFTFDKLEYFRRNFDNGATFYRNKKSLFEEMPFREFITNRCCPRQVSKRNYTYPMNRNDKRQNLKASEKLDCLPLDCLKLSETEACGDKFLECVELLYQNLGKLNETIREMQAQLIFIRSEFQEEDKRTWRLLQESRKLTRELKESNYLNEVLLLLMGQPEKIKSNNWPFRICLKQEKESNLVI